MCSHYGLHVISKPMLHVLETNDFGTSFLLQPLEYFKEFTKVINSEWCMTLGCNYLFVAFLTVPPYLRLGPDIQKLWLLENGLTNTHRGTDRDNSVEEEETKKAGITQRACWNIRC